MSEDRWSIAPLGCYTRRSVRQLCPLATVLIQEKYATFRHNSDRHVSVELGIRARDTSPRPPSPIFAVTDGPRGLVGFWQALDLVPLVILDLILKSTQCFGLEVTSLNTNELGKVLVSTQRSRPYLAVAYRGLSHGFRLLRGEEGKIRLKCPQVFLSIPKGSSLSCYSNQSWKNLPRKSFPGRSRDGAGPAELGEGGFRMNPIGVVAKDDQHLGGGVGTDVKALTQRRRGLGCESTQVTVVVHDLDGESEPATGERPEGMFRRGGRRIDRAAAPSAASFEERLVGERVEGLSQLGRRGDDDLLQRDHRRGAGFDRRPARDLEVAHHLDRPVRGLRDGGRLASQDRPRGGLGIHGVGLPGDSTCAPVAPVHFEHLVPGSPVTVKLAESESIDPQDTGPEPVVNPPC